MITQDTAAKIWKCHRDIVAGNKLLDDMAKAKANTERHDQTATGLRDAFGHERGLQLGVPSGQNAHQLFDVKPELAEAVIRAHISHKQSELAELNEVARIEATKND